MGHMDVDEFAITRGPALLGFARVLTGDRGLAEELLQDVLMRLYARRDSLGDIADLDAYAHRMISNAYVSWGRKWFRVRPVAQLPEAATPAHADVHAERDALRVELAKLTRRQRAVLVLRYHGGLSDSEIADELGCSVTTVRTHASRGLTALRIEMVADRAPDARAEMTE